MTVELSTVLWTPRQRRGVFCDIVAMGALPPDVEYPDVYVGDRIVVAPEIGLRLKYMGKRALMLRAEEVLAVVPPLVYDIVNDLYHYAKPLPPVKAWERTPKWRWQYAERFRDPA